MKGIVSKSTGSWYKVIYQNQEVDARLRGIIRKQKLKSTNPVVVGDEVFLEEEEGEYFIKGIEERKNCIVRKSNKLSKQYQLIAANIDMALLIVSPASPYTPQGFIDRFLVTAEAYHIPVQILLNKSDLNTKKANAHRGFLQELYAKIGYPIHNVSFLESTDVEQIKELIGNKCVLLSGNSGVGKSTLINALIPGTAQKTGKISKSYHKGKHTTTFAQMFIASTGARIIDTPGIKDFGLVGMQPTEISHYFPEMKAVRDQCKFSNCIHVEEPECKVLEELSKGAIDESRYLSYLSILDEIK